MFKVQKLWLCLGFLGVAYLSVSTGIAKEAGKEVLGQAAPAFQISQWLHSPPLQPKDLQGKVVLVRFWTDTCPYCARTAPVLNQLQSEYASRGFQVIGIFHPKPPQNVPSARVQKAVERFGFVFPIGVDAEWKTLKNWWLDAGKHRWTSVSFLLDRQGMIRHIHPGGDYYPDLQNRDSEANQDYLKMREAIEKLL